MIYGDEKKSGTAFPLTIIATAIAGIIVGLVVLGDPAHRETTHVYVPQAALAP